MVGYLLDWVYGIYTFAGYLMPTSVYTISLKYMICNHILYENFLNKTELIFIHS